MTASSQRPDAVAPSEDELATRPAPVSASAKSSPSRPSAGESTLRGPVDVAPTPASTVVRRGGLVGRYVVLRELGAGAMGRVYQAYDPKLDRRIALKVLRVDPSLADIRERAERRLLREAQALAQLRHPNVVAVHDAELTDEGLAVAMDYIEGDTLRQWLRADSRTWTAIVDVMRDAAAGLAAAHRAGLVHRDFKPDNVMIDANGRAHVVDFGLAQAFDAASTSGDTGDSDGADHRELLASRTFAHAGTPAYMAPEQHQARPTGPAADQFAWCVTLYEALWDTRPFPGRDLASLTHAVITGAVTPPPRGTDVPAFVRDALLRGLRTDPSERFETMDALVGALESDPAARRRRIALTAGALALTGLGAYGWLHDAHATPCQAGVATIAAVWGDAQRAAVDDALRASDKPYAATTAVAVTQQLDAYAADWARMLDASCTATEVEGRQSPRMLDLRAACLQRRTHALAAAVEVLSGADDEVTRKARAVAAGLPPLAPCADLTGLEQAVAPPPDETARQRVETVRTELAAAEALQHAGKLDQADVRIRAVEELATQTDYLPVVAEWHRVAGGIADARGDSAQAEVLLKRGIFTAQRSGHDIEMATGMTLITYVVGNHLARSDEGLLWAEHAEAAIDRVDSPTLRARLASHRGVVLDDAGRYEEALVAMQTAVALTTRLHGPDAPETLAARAGHAGVLQSLGRAEDSRAEYAAVLALTEQTVGVDHPDFAAMLTNNAMRQVRAGDVEGGLANLRRAKDIFVRIHGTQHPHVAAVWTNLAAAHYNRDDFAKARAAIEAAMAINIATHGEDHPDVAENLLNLGGLAVQQDEPADAERYTRDALALVTRLRGADHPEVGEALLQLSVILRDVGRRPEALQAAQRAEAIYREAYPADHWELGRACVALAQIHYEDGNWPDTRRTAAEGLTIFEGRPDTMPWMRGKARFMEAAAGAALGDATDVAAKVQKASDEVGQDDGWAVEAIAAWKRAQTADR